MIETKILTNDEKVISLFYNKQENTSLSDLYILKDKIVKNEPDLLLKELLLIEIDILIKYKREEEIINLSPELNTNILIKLYEEQKISKDTLGKCIFFIPCYAGVILRTLQSVMVEQDYYRLYRECPTDDEAHLMEIFNFELTGEIEKKEDEKIIYESFKKILKK